MSKQVKLTNRFIKDLSNNSDRPIHVYDTEVRGFCITVTPTGSKSYYYVGRINKRSRRVRLGSFPEMTATAAREYCRETVVEAQKGNDITAKRMVDRRTLGELFELYLNVHAKPNKRTWPRDIKGFDKHLSAWKNKPLSEIRRGLVADLIADIQMKNGPSVAHRVRALLSKMFTIAIKHEWVEFNPVSGTDRPKIPSRDRYLRPNEIHRFLAAIETLPLETSRDFIKIAIFTGARRSNLCTMRWDELDLERGVWTIPKEKFKGKRIHLVPLIPQALEILRRRKDSTGRNQWVFPGSGKTGHITEPRGALRSVKERAGIEDLRFHDLRRTMGAWQNNGGTPTRLIQGTLGHADIGTTAASYSPNEVEPIRRSMQMAVDAMTQQVREGEK